MGGSTSHVNLRFAGISLLVIGMLTAVAVLAGRQLVSSAERDATARSADRLVGTPFRAILRGGATIDSETRDQADKLAGPLLSTQLRAIRVFAPDGTLVYTAGRGANESSVSGVAPGVSWTRSSSTDGASLFTTYTNTGDYVLAIDEDARPVDARIARAQRTVLEVVLAAAALLWLLLQAGFRLATHGLATKHRRLTRLHAAGEDLRSSLDLHDVITRISREATSLAGGHYGLVALYDQENSDLLLRATYDHATDTIAHHQRAVEEWFLRRAVAMNTIIVASQAASAYRQFFGPEVEEDGQVHVLCVPMTLRDRVVGVIAVVRMPSRGRPFSPTDVQQVADLASQGTTAIEQALLFAKVRSYADEVELSYDSTLKALMAALDAKDEASEGHCERVARLTVQLARQMGVRDGALVDIERGALLHDVGKIGVPDAVLQKPASLNDREWEAMRKHPLLAGMMISKVGFLEGATPILLYHHEHYDGSGYPFGLAMDSIPLEARIFSVIDAYDAMTSDRPYRDAMPHADAMDELNRVSGTQFDPDVVQAFERMMSLRPELRARPPVRPESDDEDGQSTVPARNAESAA